MCDRFFNLIWTILIPQHLQVHNQNQARCLISLEGLNEVSNLFLVSSDYIKYIMIRSSLFFLLRFQFLRLAFYCL